MHVYVESELYAVLKIKWRQNMVWYTTGWPLTCDESKFGHNILSLCCLLLLLTTQEKRDSRAKKYAGI